MIENTALDSQLNRRGSFEGRYLEDIRRGLSAVKIARQVPNGMICNKFLSFFIHYDENKSRMNFSFARYLNHGQKG